MKQDNQPKNKLESMDLWDFQKVIIGFILFVLVVGVSGFVIIKYLDEPIQPRLCILK